MIEQVDRLPFPAQPDTREWYARMLTERAEPGDAGRAGELLGEAVAQYEAMGMVAFAGRAAKLREAIARPAIHSPAPWTNPKP